MDTIQNDVTIIGAGPGGTTTAMFLAKKGISSLVIDKATFPRDKICGDALSGKVVEVMKKLDPSMIERLDGMDEQVGSYGVTFVAPNFKSLDVPFKTDYSTKSTPPPGFISKRIDFDHYMVREMSRYPEIEFIEGEGLKTFTRNDNGFELTTDKGRKILTRLVIAADGAHSAFARQVGGIEMDKKHYCAGLRAYYKGVKDLHKDNFIELHFLKDFLPGYFWVFPLPNGMANVGVGMRSDFVSKKKVNLKQRMLEIIEEVPSLKERFGGAELVDDIKGFGLPLGSKKRRISGDNFILTGDAASLIDPFTGEGIGNAMISGMIAADAVETALETNNVSAAELAAYDKEVYRRLWSELKLSARMQYLVRYPKLFNLVVNKAHKNKTLRETISCMFEDLDMRERLKKPSFYFKLIFN